MAENSVVYINVTAMFWEVMTEIPWPPFFFFWSELILRGGNVFKDLMKLLDKESNKIWLLNKSSYLNGDFRRRQ